MRNPWIFIIFLITSLSQATYAFEIDPSDFADEVIRYTPGTGLVTDWVSGLPFTDPNSALGPPTMDTTGDGFDINVAETVPIVPVYQAFRHYEITIIGTGGELILKFDHPVANDSNNPYGIDFIVFGNAIQFPQGLWLNRNPHDMFISDNLLIEQGLVSVAQDPNGPWVTFDNGPYADDFAPTLGRVYDPNNADPTLGAWNQWWSQPTNPTLPLDPSLTTSDLIGKTVAQAALLYGQSAGGTGFDLDDVGLDWFQYLKIENLSGSSEIDAIADVSACGDFLHPFPPGDLDFDCRVNMFDVPYLTFSNIFDIAENWLTCSWECD